MLWRENQRISLRSFLRSILHNPQVVNTKAVQDFLSTDTITPTDADVDDIRIRNVCFDEMYQNCTEAKKIVCMTDFTCVNISNRIRRVRRVKTRDFTCRGMRLSAISSDQCTACYKNQYRCNTLCPFLASASSLF